MTILNRLTKRKPVGFLNRFFTNTTISGSSFARKLSTGDKNGLRVVFFGSDYFSVRILRALKRLFEDRKISELAVITSIKTSLQDNNDNNQVVDLCSRNNINYHIWSRVAKNDDYMNLLKGYDVGVLASFGHLIPSKLINLFPQ